MTRSLSLPGQPLTVDDVHAMFDAAAESDRAALIAMGSATIERAKLRDAVHRHGARVLGDLGIDSPELRWKAARALIKRYRDAARAKDDAAAVLVMACIFALRNAEFRGTPGWVIRRDVLEARAQVKRFYGDAAATIVSKSQMCSFLLQRETSAR